MNLEPATTAGKAINQRFDGLATDGDLVELSVVMPCLNERETVGVCVRKAIGRT